MENKEKELHIRMEPKLYQQLKKYADRNDEGLVSTSARKAIRLFLEENK